MNKKDLSLRHKMVAEPVVRVRAGNVGGSGTILWQQKNSNNEYSTYVLTNHHVVEKLITVKDQWSSLLKKDVKMDFFTPAEVHIFTYRWESRAIGGTAVQANIVAYDSKQDLALLNFITPMPIGNVAKLYPKGKESELQIGQRVIAIGAGLGEPPVQTEGILSQFGREIDGEEFWLNSAAIIFGNSGGALFLADTYEFIGVPARVAVSGWGHDAITHLAYAIPITRVYRFLDEQRFRFIYDPNFTEDGEAEERKRLREESERLRLKEGK